ncbi:MAG: lipopolysaccharide biosynthesis protein [Prochloraceae cyanobacterium]|nr:lipopolysaccharide biosynthesis protein [Prochloraceae cyanobacterium]
MNFLIKMGQKLKQLDNSFIRNVGWLSAGRLVIRVTRLMTTIVLARYLTPHDYGLAAIVLTANELVRVFTRNGVGKRLIQVEQSRVEYLAQSAYWLNWLVFVSLFVIQCLAAFPLAWFYQDNQIILPICTMALSLLIVPTGLVQATLLQREGRFKIIAITEMIQISSDNLLSLVFAFGGLGMWAIVLPKILVTPIWAYSISRNHSWKPKGGFTTDHWGEMFRFGRNIVGVELLNTLRSNLDYLIVGRFLSIEALGIYYFAFNAGLGISLSVINSIKPVLLPHLCQARSDLKQFGKQYYNTFKTISLAIIPLALLQSSLAPFYVPLVFGEKWIDAIPVLILICLSAIPRPFADAASQLLVAVDKPELDLYWNVIFTGLFTTGLLIGVQWQSIGVATAVLLTHIIFLPLFIFWASRYVFRRIYLYQSD